MRNNSLLPHQILNCYILLQKNNNNNFRFFYSFRFKHIVNIYYNRLVKGILFFCQLFCLFICDKKKTNCNAFVNDRLHLLFYFLLREIINWYFVQLLINFHFPMLLLFIG